MHKLLRALYCKIVFDILGFGQARFNVPELVGVGQNITIENVTVDNVFIT
jgi:hypothetical protein